jgi:hypothetical protein
MVIYIHINRLVTPSTYNHKPWWIFKDRRKKRPHLRSHYDLVSTHWLMAREEALVAETADGPRHSSGAEQKGVTIF